MHQSQQSYWLLRLLLCIAIVAGLLAPAVVVAQAQEPTPVWPYADAVKALVERMSVQQRVGQLFMVDFPGSDASATSDIADLIVNYHIGGVQLRASNQNFDNQGQERVTRQIAELTNALQTLAVVSGTTRTEDLLDLTPQILAPNISLTRTVSPTISPSRRAPASIPLFVGLANQAPSMTHLELNEITRDITQVPSELALGASWDPQAAGVVGQILGDEVSQLGINVFFGPALEVMDTPRPNTPGDLDTRVFGGDPYWVGKFGQAYTSGLHRGSRGHMAVVAEHFPGLGSSDRDVSEEIPTVQKSLDQLKQVDLAPFFAVTKPDGGDAIADGLLVSHIRYRGFQGNIRASTRPVSLDPQAYQVLMQLPEIAPWRASGGVTFSDALGERGIRRFYDPLETTFNARRIAQEAFVAGNDVLVLGNFGLSNSWPEQLANIKDAIQFFQTKYVDDPTFAALADAAVARVLNLKLRLYNGSFALDNVSVDMNAVEQMQPHDTTIASIAKQSITLLSPNARDLSAVLPAVPNPSESIVFITDDRQIRECSKCEPYPAIPRTALENIAVGLYGLQKTGQVDPSRVTSFTLTDLLEYNANVNTSTTLTPVQNTTAIVPTSTPVAAGEPPEETPTPRAPQPAIQTAIDNAAWIIIAMLDTNPAITSTTMLRNFLSQSADALRDKRVIVYAAAAPYYLDATEISKITAYYGVHSRTPIFLETAMRVLFGEFAPQGSSPVSVPGLNYTLLVQTQPDPERVIPIVAGDNVTDTVATPSALQVKIGDKLQLRAGPILDHNGRIVPDGTQVQFVLANPDGSVVQRLPPQSTRDGIAEMTLPIERQGTLLITAEADPAIKSYKIQVNTSGSGSSIEVIKPTVPPTETPQPTAAPTERPTPVPTLPSTPIAPLSTAAARASLTGFVITFLALLGFSTVMFITLSNTRPQPARVLIRLRAALLTWTIGWVAYMIYALGAFGMNNLADVLGWVGSPLLAIGVALVVVFAVMLVALLRSRSVPSAN